jgi:hypothetical protein
MPKSSISATPVLIANAVGIITLLVGVVVWVSAAQCLTRQLVRLYDPSHCRSAQPWVWMAVSEERCGIPIQPDTGPAMIEDGCDCT